jgi:DNA-binding MarR family transcriptional regulator
MKNPIIGLRKEFENRIKLGIMSVLMVNETMDFNELKSILEVTDGNLASHLRSLEKSNYITFSKSFLDRKPLTRYRATPVGKKAFMKHIHAIENLLQS